MTQILIIAGGLGTRMEGLTKDVPKCMLEVNGKPFIQHQLEIFKQQGFTDIIFCLRHLAEVVQDYFKDGSEFGLDIEYSVENNSLGTAGAVKNAEHLIDDDFIVFYGDNYTNMDFNQFIEQHKGIATVNVRKNETHTNSSMLLTLNMRIVDFIEKPNNVYINNGIYVCNKEILNYIPENVKYDFGYDLFPELIKQNKRLYAYTTECYYKEIGTIKKYNEFRREFNDLNTHTA